MSVRVNLLPEATKQRDRAASQRAVAALAGVVMLAGLGGVYLWASSEVSDAEDTLASEQARTSGLRSEKAELIAFQELADRRDRSDEVLMVAMSREVSLAGLLQDFAFVVPTDTQFDSLSITLAAATEPGDTSVGSFNIAGKTLTSHAPGVERVMISLDKVVSLRELYLNSSTLDADDERIATFSLDGRIGPEAETNRYVNGLPEEWR